MNSNSKKSALGFNGELLDTELNQYILGNGYRAYNPALQRFTSPDNMSPFGKGGINSYTYCKGDPINQMDPTGHGPLVDATLIEDAFTNLFDLFFEEADANIVEAGVEKATTANGVTARGTKGERSISAYHAEKASATSSDSSEIGQGDIFKNLKNNPQMHSFIENPKSQCLNCAEFVNKELKGTKRTIGMLIWNGPTDLYPENHFAVLSYEHLVTVIDPTMSQYFGCKAFLGSVNEWMKLLHDSMPGKLIKAKEYISPQKAEAEIGAFLKGSALDFNGVVINKPLWYGKIERNIKVYRGVLRKIN